MGPGPFEGNDLVVVDTVIDPVFVGQTVGMAAFEVTRELIENDKGA